MTVTLPEFIHEVTPQMQHDLRLAMQDAVNASALHVTTIARFAVQAMLGPEQRLSGYMYNRTGSKVGGTITEAGGRRINPAYKRADSNLHPVALIGARGPAHFIEHSRRGGYVIDPAKFRLGPRSGAGYRKALEALGFYPGEAEALAGRAEQRRAIGFPDGNARARVKGGSILRTQGPIGRTFDRAPSLIYRVAEREINRSLDRQGR